MEKEKWINLSKKTMGVYAMLFAGGALLFLFFGAMLLENINSGAGFLGLRQLNSESGLFWRILTVSMMTNITVLSFLLWKDPFANRILFLPLIFCKFTSSLLGILLFAARAILPASLTPEGTGSFAVLVIFITDFPLGAWALYLYRKRPQ